MLKLRDGIVELYRKVATSIPPDVEEYIKTAHIKEAEGSPARESLSAILENITLARKTARPVCQDTGVPVFYIKVPVGLSQRGVRDMVLDATRIATGRVPLRANSVDPLTEKNSGDNTGRGFPIIHTEETDQGLTIDLMLKGAGSENVGQTYKLPMDEINAQRDLDGVRKCVLDAVHKAQGRACPPYVIGVSIAASKDIASRTSKEQLLRKLTDTNQENVLAELEGRILGDINELGIGPLGFGGRTTALAVKMAACHRHPASYFVDVSFGCWALRRGRLVW